MDNKNISLSLILAGIATFMVYVYMDNAQKEVTKNFGEPVNVLIAKEDIKELEIITEDKLEVKPIPRNFVQPFGSKNYQSLSKEEVVGRVAQIPILKGEQISVNKVTALGARTGLSRQISRGKRAIAVPVSNETGVSKMIKPGDRVDLLAFIRIPLKGLPDKKEVRTILQNVLILSIGTYVANDIPKGVSIDDVRGKVENNLATYTGYTTVTLEVDPLEAQKIIYLQGNGSTQTLFLSLRNNLDSKFENLPTMELGDVVNGGTRDISSGGQ